MLSDIIKQYLIDNNLYHESDDILIDEITFNVELLNTAKADIKENGIKSDITRDPDKEPFFQKNRAVDVYGQALKQLTMLFRMLALSPSERQKLKLALEEGQDDFDKTFN